MTYADITGGMDEEQRLDFDYTINQPPGREHMRRPKGAGALMDFMSGQGARP